MENRKRSYWSGRGRRHKLTLTGEQSLMDKQNEQWKRLLGTMGQVTTCDRVPGTI